MGKQVLRLSELLFLCPGHKGSAMKSNYSFFIEPGMAIHLRTSEMKETDTCTVGENDVSIYSLSITPFKNRFEFAFDFLFSVKSVLKFLRVFP